MITIATLNLSRRRCTGMARNRIALAGTPKPAISRHYSELTRILQPANAKERLAAIDFEPVGNSPEVFAAYIRKDILKWAIVVKDCGANADQLLALREAERAPVLTPQGAQPLENSWQSIGRSA